MAILSVENIHTYYGDSHILQGVSIEEEEGMVAAVLGRNGVGKTTLVHSIMGLVHPAQGRIIFRGQDITRSAAYQIARKGIRLVPQGRRLFPSLTVKQTLEISLNKEREQMRSIESVLSLFPTLKARLTSRAGNLSGGEQQMLTIGRALVGNPDFLIADEPTEGLHPMIVEELMGIIMDLKTQGLSILLIEQNLQFALELADYVYIMTKGRVVYQSCVEELLLNEEVKLKYLGI